MEQDISRASAFIRKSGLMPSNPWFDEPGVRRTFGSGLPRFKQRNTFKNFGIKAKNPLTGSRGRV
jgi:hypothetical protein